MSVDFVKRKAQETIFELGRGALHAIAPDDFEFYACTLELVNSAGNIEDIFHFPVMPSGISVGRQSLLSIKKSGSSYLTQFNNSFVGKSISINGTFGRRFRLLLNRGVGNNINDDFGKLKSSKFDLKVKTGYGAMKLLENIIEKSQKLDEYGQPKYLVFYNYTLNHNHIVEVLNFSLQQSVENNMMWNYSMELKAVAPADALLFSSDNKTHLYNLLAMNALNKATSKILGNITLTGSIKKIKKIL
jgi:hypothetical protein